MEAHSAIISPETQAAIARHNAQAMDAVLELLQPPVEVTMLRVKGLGMDRLWRFADHDAAVRVGEVWHGMGCQITIGPEWFVMADVEADREAAP